MSRYRVLIRTLMFAAFAIIVLAAVLVDGNGTVFGLEGPTSNILMIFLFSTCAISACLAIVYDKAMRIIAVAVLLTFLLMFMPAL